MPRRSRPPSPGEGPPLELPPPTGSAGAPSGAAGGVTTQSGTLRQSSRPSSRGGEGRRRPRPPPPAGAPPPDGGRPRQRPPIPVGPPPPKLYVEELLTPGGPLAPPKGMPASLASRSPGFDLQSENFKNLDTPESAGASTGGRPPDFARDRADLPGKRQNVFFQDVRNVNVGLDDIFDVELDFDAFEAAVEPPRPATTDGRLGVPKLPAPLDVNAFSPTAGIFQKTLKRPSTAPKELTKYGAQQRVAMRQLHGARNPLVPPATPEKRIRGDGAPEPMVGEVETYAWKRVTQGASDSPASRMMVERPGSRQQDDARDAQLFLDTVCGEDSSVALRFRKNSARGSGSMHRELLTPQARLVATPRGSPGSKSFTPKKGRNMFTRPPSQRLFREIQSSKFFGEDEPGSDTVSLIQVVDDDEDDPRCAVCDKAFEPVTTMDGRTTQACSECDYHGWVYAVSKATNTLPTGGVTWREAMGDFKTCVFLRCLWAGIVCPLFTCEWDYEKWLLDNNVRSVEEDPPGELVREWLEQKMDNFEKQSPVLLQNNCPLAMYCCCVLPKRVFRGGRGGEEAISIL
uniref:Uncharacterized protein n=1 Tax=Phaeomonas parva TaxID=124430 RepID=A0A6U4IRH0_9STRA|mmetsp:Transcript_3906/g.11309  ORF Transcript_3906/g.11309 Transcript_3906/m.11309 type:complete len:572 (+) Transcript_3906:260-1975(+)